MVGWLGKNLSYFLFSAKPSNGLPWSRQSVVAAAAAAKSLQSCPTLCDSIDSSPPGSPVPGILQARTLEWVAISFSNAWKWKVKVKSLSRVWLLATPWTAAYQAPLSMGLSRQGYWSGMPLPSPLIHSALERVERPKKVASLHSLVAQTVKKSACNARDTGLIPQSGISSKEGNNHSLQYSCLENSMNRGGWWASGSPWDCKESDMAEWLTYTHTHFICLLVPGVPWTVVGV